MSETIWLASDNPMEMLQYLSNRVTERKLRLFALSCWGWGVPNWGWHYEAVKEYKLSDVPRAVERFADGEGTRQAIEEAIATVRRKPFPTDERDRLLLRPALEMSNVLTLD